MIKLDEDALICDLAETYQIYDYIKWPPKQVAIFANGLRDDSRIKMSMSHSKIKLDTILLSTIADNLRLLLWSKTKDGAKGINIPKSIANELLGSNEAEKIRSYSSGKDFERARNQLLKGVT